MRQWMRTCDECGHKVYSASEPKDKSRPGYIYRVCPKCKSEAFDYGSWRGYDTAPWREKFKALSGAELTIPEAELDELITNYGDEGLFQDNELYHKLIEAQSRV